MRITVIGSHMHYNLEDYSVRALRNLGHDVQFIGYNEINGRIYGDLLRMITTRSAVVRKISIPFWLKHINASYRNAMTTFNPDVVLSIKGESVLPETLSYISSNIGAIRTLWYPDDPRFFNSLAKRVAPFYDHVFSSSENGTKMYRQIGIEAVHRLPFGCNEKVHYRENWNGEPLDRVIFVGTFTLKRYRFVKNLVKKGVEIDLIGKYWKNFFPSHTISESAYGPSLTKLFQRYKLSLNIHNDIQYGPNMRTFEVTGSGGTLLTDMAEDMDKFFIEGKEVFMYRDLEELTKLINGKISEEIATNQVAKNGYRRAHASYTYEKVMGTFLSSVSDNT